METYTLPQLVLEIAKQHKTGNPHEASVLFQILYTKVRDRAYKVYVGVLFEAFKTTKDSQRADEVFLKIIGEIERYIQRGKFPELESDVAVIGKIISMVRFRAYSRTVNAMKSWSRTPVIRSADLPLDGLSEIPDTVDSSEEKDDFLKQGIGFVFGKLSVKDADLLRTRYYGELTQDAADAVLMERYGYSKAGSLHKAIWWAEQRFKSHWKEFLRLYYRQSNNTNLKTIRDETPS